MWNDVIKVTYLYCETIYLWLANQTWLQFGTENHKITIKSFFYAKYKVVNEHTSHYVSLHIVKNTHVYTEQFK